MIVLLSLLMTLSGAVETVTPYGAKDLSLGLGGRSFVSGYDAIRVNPAGTGLLEEGEGEFGFGINFGQFTSLSAGYVDSSGWHMILDWKDIASDWTVESMAFYTGFSGRLSDWWLLGFNFGYTGLRDANRNGWDINFGIDFGPGLKTATGTGLIGSITIRNPFENGGEGEVSAGIGYSYRSVFSVTVDNIIVFRNNLSGTSLLLPQKRDDIVFAVESFPTDGQDFSMTASARVADVTRQNHVQAGIGFGYVGESFRFDVGLYFTDIQTSFFKNTQFGFSLISGV